MYGPIDAGSDELDAIETASVEAYLMALITGVWAMDNSSLLQVGEPLAEGMDLCSSSVSDDITWARQTRVNYLNDLSFLNYLRSL